jgi:Cft2 family RNA processing exonuclease
MSQKAALTILGGAREIGANSYFLDLGRTGLLLDSGLHPKKQGFEALPDFSAIDADSVDAILISHAHLDHVGALPVALQRFPRARVYMTACTALLSIRMLRNSVAVSRRTKGRPLYTHDHVEWLEHVISSVDMDRSFPTDTASGVEQPRVTFISSGHVLGAAGILVEHGGKRLFYTGDTCASRQYICNRARYPDKPVDLLLLECTHGADSELDLSRARRSFGRASAELGRFIATVTGRGGSVLLPVFALGRTQEILGVLHQLMQSGQIEPLPLFISGLAHAICRIYDATSQNSERRHRSFRLEDLAYRVLDGNRIANCSAELLESPILLALTSGMMTEGTSSNILARRMLSDARHGIAFVGYLDPDSPGHRVSSAEVGQPVDIGGAGGSVQVACSIQDFDFTAHSRASQLLQVAHDLQPKRVVLVHGDEEAAEQLCQSLTGLGAQVHVAQPGEMIEF